MKVKVQRVQESGGARGQYRCDYVAVKRVQSSLAGCIITVHIFLHQRETEIVSKIPPLSKPCV